MEPNEKQKPKKGKSEHLLDLMLHLGQRAAPCGQRAAPLDQLRLRLRDYEKTCVDAKGKLIAGLGSSVTA